MDNRRKGLARRTEFKKTNSVEALRPGIVVAIKRAKALDGSRQQPWPKQQCTRVYELVEKLRGTQ